LLPKCTLAGAVLLVGCDRAADRAPTALPSGTMQQEVAAYDDQLQPAPFDGAVVAPAPLDVDVTQLLPETVELLTPAVCGDVTVYDQEDLATLCSPTTLAATPIVSPTCPQTVSGSVRLETDLICTNTNGLIVGSDNTVIDLNGHRIVCTGAGYFGSCQGGSVQVGISANNYRNVHIFSHLPEGTIDGFDRGIRVPANSRNVKVKQIIVTGPAGAAGVPRPPFMIGISITGVGCDGGTVRIGGGTQTANEISHHSRGVEADFSACVYIGANRVHDNRKNILVPVGGSHAVGIILFSSSNNHIRSNLVTHNADGFAIEGGIALAGLGVTSPPTTSNLVVNNESDENDGNGVETIQGATDNDIVNNQMLRNANIDAFSDQSGVNSWNENNQCVTQTTPQPPPGVCSPDDAP